jgi:acyl-CoA hydrolase
MVSPSEMRSEVDHRDVLPRPRRARAGRVVPLTVALAAIPDGARVYVSAICSVPVVAVQGLVDERDRWQRLELVTDYLIEPLAAFAHPRQPFWVTSLQPTAAVDAMAMAGALRRVPTSYAQYASLLGPAGPLPVDVALVQVSEPGPEGRFSLGVAAGATADVVRTAELVVAEVNPAMPYTFGASECERDMFDFLVEVEHPLLELPGAPPDDVAAAIGAHAAAEIVDGAVLQLGIGAIPESILGALGGHRDLGLHGGMVLDAVIDLVEAGVMNGVRKSLDQGLLVAGGVIGTRQVFDWVHRNPALLTVGSAYSHGVPVLARLERFTAVNSAIEVSGDGSVNAEMAGARVVSGPGGQPDFAIAASLAPQGRSIIALRSTAAGGARSRLVPRLAAGAPVTVPRYLVDRVVTEHGVARLRGLALEDRPAALAPLCDAPFREAMEAPPG